MPKHVRTPDKLETLKARFSTPVTFLWGLACGAAYYHVLPLPRRLAQIISEVRALSQSNAPEFVIARRTTQRHWPK